MDHLTLFIHFIDESFASFNSAMHVVYHYERNKLHKWPLWFAENCHFGPKMFGLAPEVQNFHFVASLV